MTVVAIHISSSVIENNNKNNNNTPPEAGHRFVVEGLSTRQDSHLTEKPGAGQGSPLRVAWVGLHQGFAQGCGPEPLYRSLFEDTATNNATTMSTGCRSSRWPCHLQGVRGQRRHGVLGGALRPRFWRVFGVCVAVSLSVCLQQRLLALVFISAWLTADTPFMRQFTEASCRIPSRKR